MPYTSGTGGRGLAFTVVASWRRSCFRLLGAGESGCESRLSAEQRGTSTGYDRAHLFWYLSPFCTSLHGEAHIVEGRSDSCRGGAAARLGMLSIHERVREHVRCVACAQAERSALVYT